MRWQSLRSLDQQAPVDSKTTLPREFEAVTIKSTDNTKQTSSSR